MMMSGLLDFNGSSATQCFIINFGCSWGTVCKTVRPMLSDSLSVLPVTLVYCGQMVGWINMKLGMQVGLGPGHIVLDGDAAPQPP